MEQHGKTKACGPLWISATLQVRILPSAPNKKGEEPMIKARLHLRADEANGKHTKITVFSNGANCGQLTFDENEAVFFHHCIAMSRYSQPGEVISSGKWTKE